jgi:hypothetical protein
VFELQATTKSAAAESDRASLILFMRVTISDKLLVRLKTARV